MQKNMATNPCSSNSNVKSNKKRQIWTHEEDSQLVGLVKVHGENWAKIAALTMRTGKQCRERWLNHLEPNIKVGVNWTSEEENMFIDTHSRLGNKWTLIAKHLGRTENDVKNHWNTEKRKILSKRTQPNTLLQNYIYGMFFGNNQTTELNFYQYNPSLPGNSMRENIPLSGEGSGVGVLMLNDMFVHKNQAAECSYNVDHRSPAENVPRGNIQFGGEGSSGALDFNELYVDKNMMPECSFNNVASENIPLTEERSAMEALWDIEEWSTIEEPDHRLSEAEATLLAHQYLMREGLGDLIDNSSQQNMMQGTDYVPPYYEDENMKLIDHLLMSFNSDSCSPHSIFKESNSTETILPYGCIAKDQIQSEVDLSNNGKGKMPAIS